MTKWMILFSGKTILPFQPLSMAFKNVNYYVDTPQVTKDPEITYCSRHGFNSNMLAASFPRLSATSYWVEFILLVQEMRARGFKEKKLQLLCDITGAFRPGVLTALMGVSGAGKTTLMDVLSGRKTGGTIQGEITVGGFPKVQKTFARISGYCEQFDIHSPQITIQESVQCSAWLRLPPEIDSNTKAVKHH